MNITLNRRNACLLTAVGAALPLVGLSCPANAQEVPLAIKGYDPVAYFTDGKPVQGKAEFEFEWDDHRWRFASAEHRDLFKPAPARPELFEKDLAGNIIKANSNRAILPKQ